MSEQYGMDAYNKTPDKPTLKNNPMSLKNQRLLWRPLGLKGRSALDSATNDTALTWSVRAGYPRITVFLNTNNTEGNKYDNMITATFTLPMVTLLANLIIKVADETVPDGKEEIEFSIDSLKPKWENNVKTDQIIIAATTVVGLEKSGKVYLAIKGNPTTVAKFPLLPDKAWFVIKKGDKNITDSGGISKLYAKSYAQLLLDVNTLLTQQFAVSHDTEDLPPPRQSY